MSVPGRKLSDFGALSPAEAKLCHEVGTGEVVEISPSRPGPEAGEAVQIRADFIRYLLLGGAGLPAPVHEHGVRVQGARIIGGLDLDGCEVAHDLALLGCQIDEAPVLRSARLRNLFLDGSRLPGLTGDRLTVSGNIHLRRAEVSGELRLAGAKLGGDLVCNGGQFSAGETGKAIAADGLQTGGNVFLRAAKITGELRLLGAKLGGNLVCNGGQFSAALGRNSALSLDGIEMTGAFFLREGAKISGRLDMVGAQFGALCDAPDCWPEPGELTLDRCRYGAFVGKGITAAERIRWLGLQAPERFGKEFWPQPYEHCAKVLREMGHQGAARKVLIEKERVQRAARRARLRKERLFEDAYWVGFWDFLLAIFVRYGRQPLLAFVWLAGFWAVGAGVFGQAAAVGAIKPNQARILRSPEWVDCAAGRARARPGEAQLACFLRQPEAASYPRFNAGIYSADTLLPIVDLEMQGYWLPDESKGFGIWARWYLWVQIAMGWALSLLAVAGFSGLIKSD